MVLSGFPERIVCLTEETTETLYRLGEGDRVFLCLNPLSDEALAVQIPALQARGVVVEF